jgi:hypothetical protein
LDQEYLDCKQFLLCVATWGAEPLLRIVNACSLLQCLHHSPTNEEYKRLRDDAAFSVYAMVDTSSDELRKKADTLRRRCQAEYRPHGNKPDTKIAKTIWFHLGAPWFGLETCLSNFAADRGESEPVPSNPTWIARQTVWPTRALDAAAHWSSYSLISTVLRSALVAWSTVGK